MVEIFFRLKYFGGESLNPPPPPHPPINPRSCCQEVLGWREEEQNFLPYRGMCVSIWECEHICALSGKLDVKKVNHYFVSIFEIISYFPVEFQSLPHHVASVYLQACSETGLPQSVYLKKKKKEWTCGWAYCIDELQIAETNKSVLISWFDCTQV